MRAKFDMPHPAVLLDNCPQLMRVIGELEAGTYPQPDTAIWRDDLPRDLAVRLAKATGATDEQIAEITAEPRAKSVPAEPTTWLVAVTAAGDTQHTEYRNGKDAHRVASDASRAPEADIATVTFNGCVTTYRDGVGTGPDEAASEPEPEPDPEPDPEPAPGCKRLTIKHTHEDGTLLYGSEKGDGVYELIGPRSGARFRFFPSIRMIGIAQSRDHLAKRWQINMAAEALRKAGHVVTVEIDDTPRDAGQVKADRAERLDDRAEALTAKARRKQAEGDSRHAAAEHYAERFAGGQPILRGHHSERSARADHKRMEGHDRAANAAWTEAERAAAAASVVGKEEARRETPPRIRRRLERLRAELRQTNHHINGTRPANDWRGAYYAPEATPASGAYLEQLTARRTFLEHQIAADEAALKEHEANGYVMLTRETVHKGDIVTWALFPHDVPATVTRVNPKTVTLDRTRWPSKLGYEQIKTVKCPHEGTEVAVTARRPAAREREPVTVKIERPAEREAPLEVGAGSQFFPTPAPVVDRMLAAAGHDLTGMRVLEPSAGLGAIARPASARGASVDCIELDCQLAGKLREAGFNVRSADFLEVPARPEYDRVLMNPPFSGQADIRHVTHALGFLRPGGLLVAVMSAGAEFRQDKTAETFRELVTERGGRIERLPEDAFKVSGTSVRTILAVIPAPVASEPAPAPAPASEYAEAEAAGMLFA